MFDNAYAEFAGIGYFTSSDTWIHPPRTETTHEIIYVTKGNVFMEDGDESFALEKGNLILLPAHTPHRGYKESRDVSFYWLHFNKIGTVPKLPHTLENFSSPHLFRELLHHANLPEQNKFVNNSIVTYILSQLLLSGIEPDNKNSKLANEIAEWIRINVSASLTVKSAAKHFGYNSEYISKIFKKNFNMGIKEYMQNLLIKKAKDYLANTNFSVKEIAAILDFGDPNLFTNFFKYHENTVPLRYRNSYSETHMNRK